MLALLVGVFAGCGLWEFRLSSLSIAGADEISMFVGETITLDIEKIPESATETLIFLSSDSEKISVDDKGAVKAHAAGSAKITVKTDDGRLSDSVNVTAKNKPIESLTLDYTGEILQYDSAQPIRFEVNYGNVVLPSYAKIQWYIKEKTVSGQTAEFVKMDDFSNETTATLIPNGKGYYATVYATIAYDGYTFTSPEVFFGYFDRYSTTTIAPKPLDGFETGTTDFLTQRENNIDYYIAPSGEEVKVYIKMASGYPNYNPYPETYWYYISSDTPFASAPSTDDARWTLYDGDSDYILNFTAPDKNYYVFKAYCDGTLCSSYIYFKASSALVNNLTLTDREGRESAQIKFDDGDDVYLFADWNKSSTNGTEYVVWYLNGAVVKEGSYSSDQSSATYSYTPTMADIGTNVFKVRVYDAKSSSTYKEAEYTLVVSDSYSPVDKVATSLTSGQANQVTGSYSSVTVTANVAEPTKDYNATLPVYWYVNDVLVNDVQGYSVDQNSDTLTFTPSHGENNIYAMIGNVKSNITRVYCFTATEWNSVKSYVEKTFEWEGDTYNYYLETHLDACVAFSYVQVNYLTTNQNFMFNSELGYAEFNFGDVFSNIWAQYYSGGSMPLNYSISDNILMLKYNNEKGIKAPTSSSVEEGIAYDYVNAPLIDGRYNTSSAKRTSLPIDSNEKTYLVKTTDALYRAVSYGYRPTFEGANSNAEIAYNEAREIALSIIDDNMTDVEKLLAISGYIANNVVYDYAAAGAGYTAEKALTLSCYYIEGALDGLAVCDGISKLFCLLCGFENIPCVRVVGTANGGDHAWNKALVDADEDGVKEWYGFDLTWANVKCPETATSGTEVYLFDYLFLSETDITGQGEGAHIEREISYAFPGGDSEIKAVEIELYPTATNASINVFDILDFKVAKTYLKGSYDQTLVMGDYVIGDGEIDSATELALALIYSYNLSQLNGEDTFVAVKVGDYAFIDGTNINSIYMRNALNLIAIDGISYEFGVGSGEVWLIKATVA